MGFQFPDVKCPNGHMTKPEMGIGQTKQKCTTCGKRYGVTAYGQVMDVEALEEMMKMFLPDT